MSGGTFLRTCFCNAFGPDSTLAMLLRRVILIVSVVLALSGFIFFSLHQQTYSNSDLNFTTTIQPTQVQTTDSPIPTTPTQVCATPVQFLGYFSSDYEKTWEANAKAWGRIPCDHANDDGVKPLIDKWVTTTKSSLENPIHTVKDLGDPFSYFKYQNCQKQEIIVPIEPFALVGRHPYTCVDNNYLLDKNYLLLDRPKALGVTGKSWYFDLGASTWNTGAGGSSQSWVYDTYAKLGIKFDGIYAWEAHPHDLNRVMSEIPEEVKPIYHWFNVPADPTPGHTNNPLRIMKEIVKPEDFLVFKLDIDNTPIEEKFIALIANDPSIIALIDEMFFEHHINMEPLATCCWHTSHSSITMVDSANIFLGFRRKGIRMHVWV